MKKRVLVTGGAGYIGSHVVHALVDQGYDVTVVDLLRSNRGTGNAWAVPKSAKLYEGNCGDTELLRRVFDEAGGFSSLLHFAAWILVDESVREPARYYENNVVGSLRLFEHCLENGVQNIVFSSTAATYGNAKPGVLIREDAPLAPINPYGHGKLMVEQILRDLLRAQNSKLNARSGEGARSMTLRYFNPAGAKRDLTNGQARPVASHLVNVAAEAAIGKRPSIKIFGTDYETPDGTCLRDYIHIEDLAHAHVLALRALENGSESKTLNVGYGRPNSVLEVIETMKRVTGVDFKVEREARRVGDPPFLAADASLIRKAIGWEPQFDSLDLICKTQFEWEQVMKRERQ